MLPVRAAASSSAMMMMIQNNAQSILLDFDDFWHLKAGIPAL
jgi:hypothetical protein